ncbi:MAG: HEPN domain-containing protein [Acidobacteria bacterium]|nr:HEPN domain-containing protein [Acidobacteriota bacterium]
MVWRAGSLLASRHDRLADFVSPKVVSLEFGEYWGKFGAMLKVTELDQIAHARLADAQALLEAGRYDGAVYICGYAVEIALKARICKTLSWPGYPSTRPEFQDLQSFRTHNLDVLLRVSGVEENIKTKAFAEWSAVVAWDPEARYNPVGSAPPEHAKLMVESAQALLEVL